MAEGDPESGRGRRGVGEEIRQRVEELAGEDGITQAEAIRRVAREMGRGEPATASAFYGAQRRQRERERERPRRRQDRGGTRHTQLYSEMLPLVEAGASPEQAARRFGAEEDVEAIAVGFEEWRADESLGGVEDLPPEDPTDRRLAAAEARIVTLEAANRILMRDLEHARRTLRRIRANADAALEPGELD